MKANHSRNSISSSADNRNWRPSCTITSAAIVATTTEGTLNIGSDDRTCGFPLFVLGSGDDIEKQECSENHKMHHALQHGGAASAERDDADHQSERQQNL